MKVLKTVQWSLALMGYYNLQDQRISVQQKRRGLEALFIIIFHLIYLFHDANKIQEYVYSIFMTITTMCIFISFVSTANKTATIFILIEKIEKIFNEGKVNVLHNIFADECTDAHILKIILFKMINMIVYIIQYTKHYFSKIYCMYIFKEKNSAWYIRY